MTHEQVYRTVDVERRGYGRRYTWLPVDILTKEHFSINCAGSYVRPQMYDIRPGDIIRWREGGQLIQALVAAVQHDGDTLDVQLDDATPLPADTFYP